jgi:hypothetical protein
MQAYNEEEKKNERKKIRRSYCYMLVRMFDEQLREKRNDVNGEIQSSLN